MFCRLDLLLITRVVRYSTHVMFDVKLHDSRVQPDKIYSPCFLWAWHQPPLLYLVYVASQAARVENRCQPIIVKGCFCVSSAAFSVAHLSTSTTLDGRYYCRKKWNGIFYVEQAFFYLENKASYSWWIFLVCRLLRLSSNPVAPGACFLYLQKPWFH